MLLLVELQSSNVCFDLQVTGWALHLCRSSHRQPTPCQSSQRSSAGGRLFFSDTVRYLLIGLETVAKAPATLPIAPQGGLL